MKKYLFSIFAVGVAGLCFAALHPEVPAGASVNVTQHHNNPSRDGLFIDPAFTMAAAANLTRDLSFNGTIVGNVYSQPLYVEGGPAGPVVIVVTQSNNVYALKVSDWPATLATQCGNSAFESGQHQSDWNHQHAGCRPGVAFAFLRCRDQRPEQPDIFPERRYRRDQSRMAGGCKREDFRL